MVVAIMYGWGAKTREGETRGWETSGLSSTWTIALTARICRCSGLGGLVGGDFKGSNLEGSLMDASPLSVYRVWKETTSFFSLLPGRCLIGANGGRHRGGGHRWLLELVAYTVVLWCVVAGWRSMSSPAQCGQPGVLRWRGATSTLRFATAASVWAPILSLDLLNLWRTPCWY